MIRPEKTIREMIVILEAFGDPAAVQALRWVLGELGVEEGLPSHPTETLADAPKCRRCNGTRLIWDREAHGTGGDLVSQPCPECEGRPNA